MRGRAMLVIVILTVVLGACSHSHKVVSPQRTDVAGHVIAAGQDWSGAGEGSLAAKFAPWNSTAFTKMSPKLQQAIKCGVPPTLSPEQKKALPPGYNPNGQPLTQAQDDFPLQASLSPTKGDPGTMLTINALAVGQPGALIVVIARFFDNRHHGMRAAKFADVTGHATLVGPIPKDAPNGVAVIVVSASRNHKSALKSLTFTVTGPGCG